MSVIKAIEFPNREFASQDELHTELKRYKDTLINIKKGNPVNTQAVKMLHPTGMLETVKNVPVEAGFVYAVINTTKVLDSHNDVHLNGIWNKSVTEKQGTIFYVVDHEIKVRSVIAFPQDVEMLLKEVQFKDLGANFEGTTQALIFKIAKENIKLKEARDIIENKIPVENSVRMRYVKIDLAINSIDPDFAEEKAVWDNVIGNIANKEVAIERGYFWAVREAEILDEGSMVLRGSNDVTPVLQSKDIEPQTTTPEGEPVSTQKQGEEPKAEQPEPKAGEGTFINQQIV